MNLCKGQNPPFPIFDLGGGGEGEGLNFPFILFKIAIIDTIKWNSKNPNNLKSRMKLHDNQNTAFSKFFYLLWGGSKFSFSLSKIVVVDIAFLKFHNMVWRQCLKTFKYF